MRAVTGLFLAAIALMACGPSDDYISLTLEQRSTTRLEGLGFDGRATIYIGDIESNDLVQRGVEIEEIEIEGISQGDLNTLLAVEDAKVLQEYTFYFEGTAYVLEIRGVDTDLFFEDTVDIIIGYR